MYSFNTLRFYLWETIVFFRSSCERELQHLHQQLWFYRRDNHGLQGQHLPEAAVERPPSRLQ
uniref:Glycine alpha 1, truncated n=1 Tax=Rattus norvegicus TaxID=10116 RepID=Q99JD0_RAT|nr:glycine alpha 1 precursor, truncated [Rattus norvegicus]